MIYLWAAAALWVLWVAAQVALMLLSPYLVKSAGPFTNGFQIAMPKGLAEVVTAEEMEALVAHERGHMALRHNLWNLARACVFIPRSLAKARQQELEADDYASARADGKALASALRKLSANEFDLLRAARLEA